MSELLNRIDLNFPLVQRILARHIITENGCWEYQGYKQREYGKAVLYARELRPRKKTYRVHRIAYAYHHGVDPAEFYVCHTCDNPICINPEHLFLGTNQENMDDMARKGRRASQPGEANANSTLTESDVLEIIGLIQEGYNNKAISCLIAASVSHAQISNIRRGKSWKHVLEAANYDPEEYRVFRRQA